jgi:hypothetical protein
MGFKYAILVVYGMADYPVPELGNITPLAYAIPLIWMRWPLMAYWSCLHYPKWNATRKRCR